MLCFSQCKTPQLHCGSSVVALQTELHAEVLMQELLWGERMGQALCLPRTGWSLMPAGRHSNLWHLNSFLLAVSCPYSVILDIFYNFDCKQKGHEQIGILCRLSPFSRLGTPVVSSLAGSPSTIYSGVALVTCHHAVWSGSCELAQITQ